MKLQRVLAALMALMLLVPATTAYGVDQSVEVQVLPTGVLSVNTQEQFGFGVMVPGQTMTNNGFGMGITNTTDPATGWVVTVDAGDFESGNWQNCSPGGCSDWTPDGIATISIDNLSIVGGDIPWFDHDAIDAVVPGSGTFGSGAITLETGTADAWGSFQLSEPNPEMTLTIPGDAVTGANYRTVLTYTIAAP